MNRFHSSRSTAVPALISLGVDLTRAVAGNLVLTPPFRGRQVVLDGSQLTAWTGTPTLALRLPDARIDFTDGTPLEFMAALFDALAHNRDIQGLSPFEPVA